MLKHRSEICCLEIYAKMENLKEKYVSLKSIRLYSSGWGHQTDFAPTTYLLSQCWLQQHQSYWFILIFLHLLKLDGTNSNSSRRQQMSLPVFQLHHFVIFRFYCAIMFSVYTVCIVQQQCIGTAFRADNRWKSTAQNRITRWCYWQCIVYSRQWIANRLRI
jgi:hypothetical protein